MARMRLLVVLGSLLSLLPATLGLTPVAFRLDDIQCGWMEANSQTIIKAFIRHQIPLTVGVITGPGECYSTWLRAFLNSTTNAQLELASHSVTHVHTATLTYAQQVLELRDSRAQLVNLFSDLRTVTTFLAPYNNWNFDTVTAAAAYNYTIISGQCTAAQLLAGGQDDACTSNMYPTVSRPFFQSINGITHVDAGASTSTFDTGILLSAQDFLSGSTQQCITTAANCSVTSQISDMAGVTDVNIGEWSCVMMHPQDWADGATDSINAYFDYVLPAMKSSYEFYTVEQMTHIGQGGVNGYKGNATTPVIRRLSSSTGAASNATGSTGPFSAASSLRSSGTMMLLAAVATLISILLI